MGDAEDYDFASDNPSHGRRPPPETPKRSPFDYPGYALGPSRDPERLFDAPEPERQQMIHLGIVLPVFGTSEHVTKTIAEVKRILEVSFNQDIAVTRIEPTDA